MKWRVVVLALLLLLPGRGAGVERFTARVIGVTDGDTLTILHDGRRETVRLRGIDAPERGQPYEARARQRLCVLAPGQTVTVETTARDRHGRLLAEIRLPDGRSVGHEMIRVGLAWSFRRYSTDATLVRLEIEARASRVGLWADPDPVAPWTYRRR